MHSKHSNMLAHLLKEPCDALRWLSAHPDPVLDLFAIPFDSLDPLGLELLAFVEQTALRGRHYRYVLRYGIVCSHRV